MSRANGRNRTLLPDNPLSATLSKNFFEGAQGS
jgi:hypothetical protein